MQSNVVDINLYRHLRRKSRFPKQTQATVEKKIYEIMIKASGLPDFHENYDQYIWYATEYCFSIDCELRDFYIERKLKNSNPYLQLPK